MVCAGRGRLRSKNIVNGARLSPAGRANVREIVIHGEREKIPWEDNTFFYDYFSSVRAATDKRSSSVERVDQVGNDWSLKQRLGPLKSRNNFYENSC